MDGFNKVQHAIFTSIKTLKKKTDVVSWGFTFLRYDWHWPVFTSFAHKCIKKIIPQESLRIKLYMLQNPRVGIRLKGVSAYFRDDMATQNSGEISTDWYLGTDINLTWGVNSGNYYSEGHH